MLFLFDKHVPIKCIIFLDMYVINLDKTLIIQNICLQIKRKKNKKHFH